MTIRPGSLYTVSIPGRGSGTVKSIRQCSDGLVDSTVMHGRFKVRCLPGKLRIDGDPLSFFANDEGVTVKALELGDK